MYGSGKKGQFKLANVIKKIPREKKTWSFDSPAIWGQLRKLKKEKNEAFQWPLLAENFKSTHKPGDKDLIQQYGRLFYYVWVGCKKMTNNNVNCLNNIIPIITSTGKY